VSCAHACGARCLAVATGAFGVEQLQAHKPWRCVPGFDGVTAITEMLVTVD